MFELEAKSKNVLQVRMFGAVGQWREVNAVSVDQLLIKAKSDGYNEVKLLLHMPGGGIFEGIAINSVIQKHNDIRIVTEVHGLAASWGSVLVQASDYRSMIDGTRMMIHQGAGGIAGSASQIINYGNLLKTLNEDISAIYAASTGKDQKWIMENWMGEGQDKWFTAKEAKDAGLIDEVIPSKVKSKRKIQEASIEEMVAFYDDTLINSIEKKMNKEQLAKLGLEENATEEQITAALDKLVKNQKQEEKPTETPANEGGAASDEKPSEKTVNAALKMAKKSGFMTEANKETVTKLAKEDPEALIDLLPTGNDGGNSAHASVADLIKELKGGAKPQDTQEKKWDDYSPEDLAKMEEEKPEEFKALFEKTYNKKLK